MSRSRPTASAQVSHHPAPLFNGDSTGELLGSSVSGADGVNNDGFADLIVGANGDDNNGVDSGNARIFMSGACPAPPARCPGDANDDTVVNFDDISTVIGNWLNTCP